MDDQPQSEESLAEEFRNLGKNLVEVLRTGWEAPERKKLQKELEDGLNELGNTLQREAEYFSSSPAGQQFKSEVHELGERVRTGEVQNKVRQELITALQTANNELNKLVQQWAAAQGNAPASESTPPEQDKTG